MVQWLMTLRVTPGSAWAYLNRELPAQTAVPRHVRTQTPRASRVDVKELSERSLC